MKKIGIEYTIVIDNVIEYYQEKLEKLWAERQKMDTEIEMIDNVLTNIKALQKVMSSQMGVIIQNESNGN